MSKTATPNPGSDEAVQQGCVCPRMDNAYGRGYIEAKDGKPAQFIYTQDCPLHGLEKAK